MCFFALGDCHFQQLDFTSRKFNIAEFDLDFRAPGQMNIVVVLLPPGTVSLALCARIDSCSKS